MQQIFEFTIVVELAAVEFSDADLNRLFEAGCDDGTPGTRLGVSFVAFHRQAESLEDAIQSAIDNVRQAGLRVARVETDEYQTIDKVNRELATADSGAV